MLKNPFLLMYSDEFHYSGKVTLKPLCTFVHHSNMGETFSGTLLSLLIRIGFLLISILIFAIFVNRNSSLNIGDALNNWIKWDDPKDWNYHDSSIFITNNPCESYNHHLNHIFNSKKPKFYFCLINLVKELDE